MQMAKSTYYFGLSKEDVIAVKKMRIWLKKSKLFFEQNKCRYGVRRVYRELRNRGYEVNHKRVQRIMHETRMIGKRPKEKYHSYKGEIGRIASNIIDRNFTADKPLQKWTTDISQFNFSWGKCYLSPILDMATR